jgi:hypothetical protein
MLKSVSERSRSLVPYLSIVILVAAVLVSSYPYIAPGHPSSVDVWPHLSRQKIVYDALKQGFSPFYSFMFYSGYPHLRFYSPLFYFLGGSLTFLAGGDILLALKILLLMLHLFSAAAIYWYLKRRTGDTWSAALGALVYVLIPWRVRHIANLANYPQAPIYVLLPLMLLALDQLVEKPTRRIALILGFLATLAILSHVVYALFALAFLPAVFLLGHDRSAFNRSSRKSLLLAALMALLLSAFFLVPFLAEYGNHVYPKLVTAVPPPDPLVALGLRSRLGGFVGGYLGLSIVALLLLALVTLFFAPVRGRKSPVPMVVGLAGSLILAFVVPLLGRHGFFLNAGLLPERFLLFFVFFAAALVASAHSLLQSRLARRQTELAVAFCLLAGIVSLDCLRTHVGVKFAKKEDILAGYGQVYDWIGAESHSKVLDVCLPLDAIDDPARVCTYPAMGFIYGGLPTPLGIHYHQFAPRSMAYVYPWINAVAADLADPATPGLSPQSLRALALLGVSHVIMIPRLHGAEPGQPLIKPGLDWDTRLMQEPDPLRLVYGATGSHLVLASNRLQPFPAEQLVLDRSFYVSDDWRPVLDSLRIDQPCHRVNFIPVTASPCPDSLPDLPKIEVFYEQIRNQSVSLELGTSSDCFLRLSLSYYPELRVRLDGHAVEFHETKDHFIYLNCPAGGHRIEVRAPLTPLRRAMLAVSALALLFFLAGMVLPQKVSTKPAFGSRPSS